MLATIFHLKLATAMMSSWLSAASPMPIPAAAYALAFDAHAASPVEVKLYDVNRNLWSKVWVERDGSTDAATTKQLTYAFRCRSERQHRIAKKTLAMMADLAERYAPHAIEFVSVYRVEAGEPGNSPHRDARAMDFRISGVRLTEIRDYLWRTYTQVGIGWYPSKDFIHMDTRPTMNDTAWTWANGVNHYKPWWSEVARKPPAPPKQHRAGV